MSKTAQHFDTDELISKELTEDRDSVRFILESAISDTDQFLKLASKNKTVVNDISFTDLNKWLNKASKEIYDKTGRYLWTHRQSRNKFYTSMPHKKHAKIDTSKIDFYRIQDIYDAIQLVSEVERRSPDLQDKLVINTSQIPRHITNKTRSIKKTLEINGVSALELDIKKRQNLNDPLLDLSLKLNNPIGRLWRAIKRLWKSQKTTIALRLSIPFLVLPLFIYIGYRIWQGKGVSTPVSKLGLIHETSVNNKKQDLFILPTSDVYILKYGPDFQQSKRVLEKPIIVVGLLNNATNTITVSDIILYNTSERFPADADTKNTPAVIRELWDNSWNFFQYFK